MVAYRLKKEVEIDSRTRYITDKGREYTTILFLRYRS